MAGVGSFEPQGQSPRRPAVEGGTDLDQFPNSVGTIPGQDFNELWPSETRACGLGVLGM
jgi:hypothetical protein